MIDRRTLWFQILLILAMTAAAIWRLSLAPDWTHVMFIDDQGLSHTRNGLFLFAEPLCLLFMMAVTLVTGWLSSGPEESFEVHQRRNRLVLMGTGAAVALMQTFLISRSLGYGLNVQAQTLSRAILVMLAVLIIIRGNNGPKMPWLSSRIAAFQFDPWQYARYRRFGGRMSVALGMTLIVLTALLPMRAVAPSVMALSVSFMGAILWYALRLKREPSPLS